MLSVSLNISKVYIEMIMIFVLLFLVRMVFYVNKKMIEI